MTTRHALDGIWNALATSRQSPDLIMMAPAVYQIYDDMLCQWQTLNPPRPLGYTGDEPLSFSAPMLVGRFPVERRFASFKRRLAEAMASRGMVPA